MGLSDIDDDEPPMPVLPARVQPVPAPATASASSGSDIDVDVAAPPTAAPVKKAVDLDDLFGDVRTTVSISSSPAARPPASDDHGHGMPAATPASTAAAARPAVDVLDSLFAASPVSGSNGSPSLTGSTAAGSGTTPSPQYPLPTTGAIYVDESACTEVNNDADNLFDTSRPAVRQQFSTAESLLEAFSRQGKKGAAGNTGRFGNKDSLEHLTRNKDDNKVRARLLALMDYYDVLGVAPTASEEEIKRSYKKKALELHPDRVGRDQTPEEAELFKTITKANEVLMDPEKRAEYDRQLRSNGGAAGGGAAPQADWLNHLQSS